MALSNNIIHHTHREKNIQWWSILSVHVPHVWQWCVRSGLKSLQWRQNRFVPLRLVVYVMRTLSYVCMHEKIVCCCVSVCSRWVWMQEQYNRVTTDNTMVACIMLYNNNYNNNHSEGYKKTRIPHIWISITNNTREQWLLWQSVSSRRLTGESVLVACLFLLNLRRTSGIHKHHTEIRIKHKRSQRPKSTKNS